MELVQYLDGMGLERSQSASFCDGPVAIVPCSRQLVTMAGNLIGTTNATLLQLSPTMDVDAIINTVNGVHKVLLALQKDHAEARRLTDETSRLLDTNRTYKSMISKLKEEHEKELRALEHTKAQQVRKEGEVHRDKLRADQDLASATRDNKDLVRRCDQLEHMKRKLERENEALKDRIRSYQNAGNGNTGVMIARDDALLAMLMDADHQGKSRDEKTRGSGPGTTKTIQQCLREMDTAARDFCYWLVEDSSIYDKAPTSFENYNLITSKFHELLDFTRKSAHREAPTSNKGSVASYEETITELKHVIEQQKEIIQRFSNATRRIVGAPGPSDGMEGAFEAAILRRKLESKEREEERVGRLAARIDFDLDIGK
ncbi:hypothetical protein GMRT_10040 [Giardia muris]|uniref:Uncharacterized protein n=1 Tax=Giardia muris TaxID=5742 RepID=A0A4Z1SQB8_GIAMU|nr:hypothetical protein GMRT_10040 [Giardia muris]|eukprot:TNJ28042.1 hypothetical protein GMRT_10040 [Giardia muris]